MSPGEGILLANALNEGVRVFWHVAGRGADELARVERRRDFLFRRWVLEAVLVLRLQGATNYNALARLLGGPPGESLSPKLAALGEAGLSSRSVTGRSPLRVEYTLTPAGEALGAGVYALTRWKALHTLASRGAGIELPTIVNPGERPYVSKSQVKGALRRYLDATASFLQTREAYCRPKEFDEGIDTARRFCRAWVHKWHREVLQALAVGGPRRFGDLRRTLNAGDQALAAAITGLSEMRSIELLHTGEGRRYAVAAFGWVDLALAAPLPLILEGASASRRAPRATPLPDS